MQYIFPDWLIFEPENGGIFEKSYGGKLLSG